MNERTKWLMSWSSVMCSFIVLCIYINLTINLSPLLIVHKVVLVGLLCLFVLSFVLFLKIDRKVITLKSSGVQNE